MQKLSSMSEQEYDTLPPSAYGVPFNDGDLVELAKMHRALGARIGERGSGAAALETLTADMFACIAEGKDADAVVELCRQKWLLHCEANNRRIRETLPPEIAGDEWCSPVAFASRAQFVLSMVPDEEPTVKVMVFNR
jgi:hypothetical protein